MLARALCLSLLLEVALYVAVASEIFDASPAAAGLAALAGVLGLRALLVAASYACAFAWHSPAPRLSAAQTIRMVLAEYAAFVVCFVLIFPVERWWMGTDRLPGANRGAAGRRPPVLLVHGYGCSRGAWWWLRRRLEAAGWTVATISLEPVYASIDDYVEPLARRIDAVLAQTGADRLLLVGHSMGGLVARRYLQRCGSARVARLVTLGTPHQGSQLAHIGAGENARQMRPRSDWLPALANPAPLLDTVVIYSPHDNFVMPQANLELPAATARAIDGLGHLAMLFSPRVAIELLAALAAAGRAAGSRR
ncbi:MAG TPA: alpha/beta fold hydrolase [Candidatus Accumulibacter phosphatis]|nr:alpha/beta fold hydrolase [Candidatus Accumulibacter phosphatis]HRQ96214.1 alpha/beta fold hydrolase [Candidatus Accumulibacter phosphatis]HRQ97055.1 alpha/beta fold hydrolase [Candidatus Accumulibacter phosphatis]